MRLAQVIDSIRVFFLYNFREISDNICMKCENTVKIGDVVKSLDFAGIENCYYVGRVAKILDDGRFVADTMERVWEGEALLDPDRVSTIFVAPLPGRMLFDDEFTTPRIQVLA